MKDQTTSPVLEKIEKKMFPDSKMVTSLEFDGKNLIVVFKSNGSAYTYEMRKKQAEDIYKADSVGRAVLAMAKNIKGIKI